MIEDKDRLLNTPAKYLSKEEVQEGILLVVREVKQEKKD